MFLECGICGNPNIELNGPYDKRPFYCPQCGNELGFEEVRQFKSVATHYTNDRYRSILVTDMLIER